MKVNAGDMGSGQAVLFALGHVILAVGLSPSAGLPGVPGSLLPLGCFRKLSSSRPAGRVCQRLETEASQSPQGSERKGGTRLQFRLLAKDCVLWDMRPRGAGGAGVQRVAARLSSSRVVYCFSLVVQSL